ncbi:MAG: hypothetical protein WCA99_21365, partial [Candidatus Sulfotelmatobacter sp.]
ARYETLTAYWPGPEGELPLGLEPGFAVPGFDPGFEVPGFDPGFEVPGFVDPPFGAAPGFEGDRGVVCVPLGFVLGFGLFGLAFGLLGFVVDGCEPGAFGLPGVAPGFSLPDPVGGGVVLPVGG